MCLDFKGNSGNTLRKDSFVHGIGIKSKLTLNFENM